jgi:hypothetical protein
VSVLFASRPGAADMEYHEEDCDCTEERERRDLVPRSEGRSSTNFDV